MKNARTAHAYLLTDASHAGELMKADLFTKSHYFNVAFFLFSLLFQPCNCVFKRDTFGGLIRKIAFRTAARHYILTGFHYSQV